jgi:hypothetical protein
MLDPNNVARVPSDVAMAAHTRSGGAAIKTSYVKLLLDGLTAISFTFHCLIGTGVAGSFHPFFYFSMQAG